ncbi:MAG: ribosome silencing factor [Bacillaceae bacterium]|nr:ribosome silencing factor [Bacillaceae bacterium]
MTVEEIVRLATEAAEEKKAQDVVVLDIRGLSVIADYFVICHGNSETQVQSIATEIKKKMQDNGLDVDLEGYNQARWVLIDIGDVVVHVFHRDERDFYNLERLWGDAQVVEMG